MPRAETEIGMFFPPSRQTVLDLAHAALGLGPILITGDAGIGKTWTVSRLIHQVRSSRWLVVDLTPSDGPGELYRHLARRLGLTSSGRHGPGRLDIAEALAERSTDGERHALVIDEAQNLAPEVWEEVRVLANRFGQADGFAALILVGQTPLVRRFATRSLAAIEARLAAHLHLRPIDLIEAGQWLARSHPDRTWSSDDIEAIHRDSGGNPARLLRRSAALAARVGVGAAPAPQVELAAPAAASRETDLDGFSPAAMIAERAMGGPTHRPPLHVEDNAIEVGWSTDEVAPLVRDADDEASEATDDAVGIAPRLEESDQAVHDHYAALQAWREWADNQEKRTHPARTDRDLADEIDEAAEAEAAEALEVPPSERGSVRAEGYQHFAPFGQLFARMTPVREPESPRS